MGVGAKNLGAKKLEQLRVVHEYSGSLMTRTFTQLHVLICDLTCVLTYVPSRRRAGRRGRSHRAIGTVRVRVRARARVRVRVRVRARARASVRVRVLGLGLGLGLGF